MARNAPPGPSGSQLSNPALARKVGGNGATGPVTHSTPSVPPEGEQELYPNYSTTYVWVLLQTVTCVVLFLLWAPAPTKSTAIIAVGDEFVSAFRKCTGSACEDWLYIGPAGSTAASIEPSAPSSEQQLAKRAGNLGDYLDPATFYLNTGLAILAAFYISLYLVIFIAIRLLPEPGPEIPDLESGVVPGSSDGEGKQEKKEKKKVRGRKRRKLKIFAYRASRSMVVVQSLLLFGCLVACGKAVMDVRLGMQLQGSEGIGGGLFLLLMSLLITVYLTVRDLAAPGGAVQEWITLQRCMPGKRRGKTGKRPRATDGASTSKGAKGTR